MPRGGKRVLLNEIGIDWERIPAKLPRLGFVAEISLHGGLPVLWLTLQHKGRHVYLNRILASGAFRAFRGEAGRGIPSITGGPHLDPGLPMVCGKLSSWAGLGFGWFVSALASRFLVAASLGLASRRISAHQPLQGKSPTRACSKNKKKEFSAHTGMCQRWKLPPQKNNRLWRLFWVC